MIPGVKIRNFEVHRSSHEGAHHYLRSSEDAVLKGQAVFERYMV